MKFTQHPLSAAYPSMTASEFQALKDSINTIGVQTPIVIFEGQVIDGWNRCKAANELGMDCPTVDFPAETDPIDFVKAMNDARRHLTASQKAIAIVAIYQWRPAQRPNKEEPSSPLLKTKQEMAKEAGVSTKTIQQAKAAHKAGLTDAVKDGALTVKEAAKIANGKTEQPAKPALAIVKQEEPEDDHHGLTDDELIAEMRETQEENAQLQERVELMAKDDKAAEINKLLTRIAGLEGRLKQQAMQIKTATDGEKYHASVIHKLRKLLGVETHKEIIASVTELVAGRRVA